MKKNDWIFISTVLIFSLLFWKQMPGLNFLIMNAVLIIGNILMHPDVLKKRNWYLAAFGAIATSYCVFKYGDLLSIGANFISLLMVSSYTMNPNNSLLVSVLQSFCSLMVSSAFMITDAIERRQQRTREGRVSSIKWKRVAIVFLSFMVVFVFFLLYRQSNVLFYTLTEKIDLSFISIGWCCFTFGGCLVMYGYYYHHSFEGLTHYDSNKTLALLPPQKQTWLDQLMSESSEKFSGLVLLVLLNLLVLIVNFLDLSFIFSGGSSLPAGASFSAYVHQGVGMLIVSIVFAASIILFYFRGRMNFMEKNGILRMLAIAWIIQNAIMLLSTFWRNYLYVEVYGLTYKRIGVDVYLLLALIGLVTIAWKVIFKRTNAFLFRVNSWLFYSVMVSACFKNWDGFITKFNTNLNRPFDAVYFSTLSYRAYPEMVTYLNNHPDVYPHNDFGKNYYLFLNKQATLRDMGKWPSFVLQADQNYDALKDQYAVTRTFNNDLDLHDRELKSIHFFRPFEGLTELNVSENELTSINGILEFRKLQILDIYDNPDLHAINGIEALTELNRISLDAGTVNDLSPLLKMRNLKVLVTTNLSDEWRLKLLQAKPDLQIDSYNKYNDWF